MAEPGEITSNPSDPSTGPEPDLKSGPSASGKRRREDEHQVGASSPPPPPPDGEESAPKRRAKAQEVLFRIVVPSRQIGKVIGREGCRIRKIREDSKATVKIADAIARHEERVIIISSKENENQVSDAENALQQIATLILMEDDSSMKGSKVGAWHVAANTIRLLIAGSQAGSLIGVSGQNIEELRNSSGATITILAPNQLPLCASAHESDRVLQLSGDVSAVLKALEDIGVQLRYPLVSELRTWKTPPKKVISVNPANNYPKVQPPQPPNGQRSADNVTFEMVISEAMVGGLIGKNGSNISRIRNESGATIKVQGGKGEKNQRQIWFSGSSQQVELAKRSVEEYICSQLLQQSGAQQRAASTALLRQSSRSA